MKVSLQEAYEKACRILGDQIVQNALLADAAVFPSDEEEAERPDVRPDVIRNMAESNKGKVS